MFFAACAFAVLSLVSGHPCDDPCEGVVEPARLCQLPSLYGQWIAAALSLKVIRGPAATIHRSDSFTLRLYDNGTFDTTKFKDGECMNQPYNASLEGVYFNSSLESRDHHGRTSFNGVILKSSCTDCLVMTFNIDAPTYEVQTVTLYSRRREKMDLNEFLRIVKCLDMPRPYEMRRDVKLC